MVQVSSSSSEGSATVTPPTSPRPAERTQPFLQPRIILKPAILANERDSSDHLSYIRRFQSVSKAPPKKTTMEDFVAKKQPRRKKALEVFCGCGALSGAMAESGFEVKGVDFDGNKDKPQVQVCMFNLTTARGKAEFHRFLKEFKPDFVWFAPPCGTSSKAREIRRKTGPDPKPLRSKEFPDGLKSLDGEDAIRVFNANLLYEFTVEVIQILDLAGIPWAVENPTNSYMWMTSWFSNLEKEVDCRWSHMQACMHGGQRDKKTSLMYGGPIDLACLSLMCDRGHTHLLWGLAKDGSGLFATAQERNYPKIFCKRIAQKIAKDLGVVKKPKHVSGDPGTKVSAGVQPRKNFIDLIPEFSSTTEFDSATADEIAKAKNSKIPTHAIGDKTVEGSVKLIDVRGEYGEHGSIYSGTYGTHWTKDEFVDQALRAKHPMDGRSKVPQRVAQVLHDQATKGKLWLIQFRLSQLKKYKDIAESQIQKESELHGSIHKDVESVVSAKKIILFTKMLEDIDYDDMEVVFLLHTGSK